MGLSEFVSALGEDAAQVAIFCDLDGVLSPIVDDPETVVPIDGVPECMSELGAYVRTVAVVSGRPVAFLERFFAPPVELSGLYGLEQVTDGQLTVDPAAIEWLPVMSATADDARAAFGSDAVEDKNYSITVHYRGASPEFAEAVIGWADTVASQTGLDARPAKMSVELHPPTTRSKGDAVEDLLGGATSAVFFGDDTGDLPAFKRLAQLHAASVLDTYAAVLIATNETSPELHEHATDVVETPEQALDLLRSLLRVARET